MGFSAITVLQGPPLGKICVHPLQLRSRKVIVNVIDRKPPSATCRLWWNHSSSTKMLVLFISHHFSGGVIASIHLSVHTAHSISQVPCLFVHLWRYPWRYVDPMAVCGWEVKGAWTPRPGLTAGRAQLPGHTDSCCGFQSRLVIGIIDHLRPFCCIHLGFM